MKRYSANELNRKLTSIGKGVFVEYFEDFKNGSFDVLDEKKFTELAKKTRISKAKSIFNAGQEYEALENILNSKKVEQEWRDLAKDILSKKGVF